MSTQLNIFTIYAWEDKNVLLQLLRHLKPLQEKHEITIWHDDPIQTGQQWKPKIESRFDSTDIFMLLVSSDFMKSEFIKQLEFKNVIDRYKENKAKVIPIIVDECPWNTDFKADDYNFNFNELAVLPTDEKPIEDWNAPDQAFQNVTAGIKSVINTFTDNANLEEFKIDTEKETIEAKSLEQIAIDFNQKNEIKAKAEEELRRKEEAAAKKRSSEEQRLEAEAAIKIKTEEELRLKEAAAAKKVKDEELRLQAEATEKIKAKEEERLIEEKEIQSKVAEKRIFEEKQVQRKVAEERKRLAAAEAKNKLEQQQSNSKHEELAVTANDAVEKAQQERGANPKRRLLLGTTLVLMVIALMGYFVLFNKNSENEASAVPEDEVPVVVDSAIIDPPKVDAPKEAEVSFSKLAVGDSHNGGIIFTIDPSGKTGKLIYPKDAGPMPWQSAIKIHEQLGDGWRLPTFHELVLMYQTLGQGAMNNGQFVDELYWSATPHDPDQARLVRFSDGNTSYHYNKNGEHRKFQVRAVRDFSR